MPFQLPDSTTPLGARLAHRLRHDQFIWLTTVDATGMPQPTLVWFFWDEETSTILIYSRSDAKRLIHLQKNTRFALHFDGDGSGADVIVVTGQAQVGSDDPPADQAPSYLEKYRESIASPQRFAALFSVPLRIHPRAVRGYLGPD